MSFLVQGRQEHLVRIKFSRSFHRHSYIHNSKEVLCSACMVSLEDRGKPQCATVDTWVMCYEHMCENVIIMKPVDTAAGTSIHLEEIKNSFSFNFTSWKWEISLIKASPMQFFILSSTELKGAAGHGKRAVTCSVQSQTLTVTNHLSSILKERRKCKSIL